MIRPNGKDARVGFTLVELAIVLSIVGVVTAGLWRLSTNSNQQTKDQVTAQQHLALINAVKGFLADTSAKGGQAWLLDPAFFGASNVSNLFIPACPVAAGTYNFVFCSYLPPSFVTGTTNPYGQTYTVQVMQGAVTANQNYSFMVVTNGGSIIPDADGGRISSLIGGDGGFIYTNNVCGVPVTSTACGAMGAWQTTTGTYKFGVGAIPATLSGEIASLSSSSSSGFVINPEWLARPILPGDPTAPFDATKPSHLSNTMSTDLFMNPYVATDTTPIGDPVGGVVPPAPPPMPSIHLHTGFIEGSGMSATSLIAAGSMGQINLTQAKDNPYPLIQLATGCSAGDPDAACEPAINIVSGDIGLAGQVTAAKIYSASDARLKTDIRPIQSALGDIMKLSPVTYAFKSNHSKGMGVLAQDLEKIYPELVSNTRGTKYVDYNGLIGPLIGAVQELKKQNDSLRDQLHKQSLREDMLEKEIDQKAAAAP